MIGVVGFGSGWQKVGIELRSCFFYPNSSHPGMFQTFAKREGVNSIMPPGRILYCNIPIVFHNGPTSNLRNGLILRRAQLQSEASWFTALPEAALYTTAFSREFQELERVG